MSHPPAATTASPLRFNISAAAPLDRALPRREGHAGRRLPGHGADHPPRRARGDPEALLRRRHEGAEPEDAEVVDAEYTEEKRED